MVERTNPPYTIPTEYDLQMLSLLYCEAIEPGMHAYEVMDVLLWQGKCLTEYESGPNPNP